ncbi:unnamed protein product [Cercopithifilaria johnstoni]|uniref:Uncharacterized protein n=1 Tax=Cercopithifilaria johnstoni TaxID=2874296 RepID=A0A8J2M769_9BILA|nr:unnamed protein product [Cercopithifilaria johnstoni]
MRHLSHQVTVTTASTSSVEGSMIVHPSITSTSSSKFITTTDETPLDLTLRKCNQKFAERRNQENKDSPKVKRSRTDDTGHLLNRSITSDVAATAAASPTITPFSTSSSPSAYLLGKEMNWMLEESASSKCFPNGGNAAAVATAAAAAAAASAATTGVNNGGSPAGFQLARLLLAQLQAQRNASSMLS